MVVHLSLNYVLKRMHRGIMVAKRKKKCQMDFADLFDFAGNILSIVLPSLFFFPLPSYHLPRQFTPVELLWFLVNRLDVPLFVLTITIATLYTTGFGRKRLLYKLSIYLFILSMIFFFITFAQMLIGGSYRY
jgi:hypothetical protein